jgi:hypothetical protein
MKDHKEKRNNEQILDFYREHPNKDRKNAIKSLTRTADSYHLGHQERKVPQ